VRPHATKFLSGPRHLHDPPYIASVVNYVSNMTLTTDMYEVPDAVPPIHAVSSHVATDKDPSK